MMKNILRAVSLSIMLGSAALAHADAGDRIANALADFVVGAVSGDTGGQQQAGQNQGSRQYNRNPAANNSNIWNKTYNPPASFRVTSGVNYRACAGKNCNKLGTMSKGTLVTVSKMVNGWYEIIRPGQYRGYVYKNYLTPISGNAPRASWNPQGSNRPAQRRQVQPNNSYISIAFSEHTGQSNIIWGQGDPAVGDRQAVQGCKAGNWANRCKVVISGTRTCASLAAIDVGDRYAYVAWTDPNRNTARNRALSDCRQKSGGRTCQSLATQCSWDPHR